MKHAGAEALDALEPLLNEVRRAAGLIERKRGIFYRKSQAFLHFHEDAAGMFADVEIITTILENVLLIPDSALQTEGDNQIVFVALDGNKFEKRVVKLGLEQAGRVQILDGVKAGEKIVTDGSFILKSEMLKGQLGEE